MSHHDTPPGMPLIQVIHNAGSGRYLRSEAEELCAAFRAQDHRVLLTETGAGVPAIAADADRVCVVGGDGTLRHVVQAIVQAGLSPIVSVFPAGTVNLLARETGMERDAAAFARRVIAGPPRAHYPVATDDGLFLVCASIGLESRVVDDVSLALKRRCGRMAYVIAGLAGLWRWRPSPITLTSESETVECEAFYIAKGRYFAGPWSFAPHALGNDPRLHVVALRRARRRDIARFWIAMLLRRDIAQVPHVAMFTCRTLVAVAATPCALQADGDIVARLHAGSPARFDVMPEPILIA